MQSSDSGEVGRKNHSWFLNNRAISKQSSSLVNFMMLAPVKEESDSYCTDEPGLSCNTTTNNTPSFHTTRERWDESFHSIDSIDEPLDDLEFEDVLDGEVTITAVSTPKLLHRAVEPEEVCAAGNAAAANPAVASVLDRSSASAGGSSRNTTLSSRSALAFRVQYADDERGSGHNRTRSSRRGGGDESGMTSYVDHDKETPPTVLCCSRVQPEEFQVDLCPRSWYNLTDSNGFCDGVWKVFFMLCCLPLCYPCYLTRRFRRKSKWLSGEHNFRGGGDGDTSHCRSPERIIIVTKARPIKDGTVATTAEA